MGTRPRRGSGRFSEGPFRAEPSATPPIRADGELDPVDRQEKGQKKDREDDVRERPCGNDAIRANGGLAWKESGSGEVPDALLHLDQPPRGIAEIRHSVEPIIFFHRTGPNPIEKISTKPPSAARPKVRVFVDEDAGPDDEEEGENGRHAPTLSSIHEPPGRGPASAARTPSMESTDRLRQASVRSMTRGISGTGSSARNASTAICRRRSRPPERPPARRRRRGPGRESPPFAAPRTRCNPPGRVRKERGRRGRILRRAGPTDREFHVGRGEFGATEPPASRSIADDGLGWMTISIFGGERKEMHRPITSKPLLRSVAESIVMRPHILMVIQRLARFDRRRSPGRGSGRVRLRP